MMKSKFWLVALAVILRLLVSAFLFHPDIKTYNFQTSFLKKGVVNIYPYLANHKKELPLKEEFVYFPLTYFVVGGYQAVASIFLGNGFNSWLSDAGSISMVRNPSLFRYLVFLKLPYLILDIATAFVLMGFFGKKEDKEKVFTLWLFNPFTIFIIYAYSNLDLYPVFLTLFAFLAIKQEKLIKGSLFLGLAVCFKLYPLLFLPFVFLKGKDLKEKLLIVFVPIVLLLATIVPFYSTSFVNAALVSGLTTRIFSPGIPLGFGETIIMSLVVLAAVFFYAWLLDRKINLFNYWILLLLVIFSFAHFHINWLLWACPFLVILIVKKPKLTLPIVLWIVLALLIPLFYQDRSMTISLFRTYSTIFDLLPIPFNVIQKFYDPYGFQSLIHSTLAGLTVILSFKLFEFKKEKALI